MQTRDRVVKLAKDGVPPKQIAEVLHLRAASVHYHLREARSTGEEIPHFKRGTGTGKVFRIELPLELRDRLADHARRRKASPERLAARLVRTVLADGLVDAVLDDGGADG